jgi:hypothetical protein
VVRRRERSKSNREAGDESAAKGVEREGRMGRKGSHGLYGEKKDGEK